MKDHMPDGFFVKMTAEEEADLRSWAKSHFVVDREPDKTWHPVIHDEWNKLQEVHDKMAHEHTKAILVTNFMYDDKGSYIQTPCSSHDEFQNLPNVITFKDDMYGKTGWNSDIGVAAYSTNTNIAWVMTWSHSNES